MDLIHATKDMMETEAIQTYDLDMAIGSSENDFTLTINRNEHRFAAGEYIYAYDTDYGGVIDDIESDTANETVTYHGRTWTGILEGKIIEPDSGKSYLYLSGEANTVLSTLISRMGLSGIFTASTENSGFTVSSYKVKRYKSGYSVMTDLLKTVGARPDIKMVATSETEKTLMIKAVPIYDYSMDDQFSSDTVDIDVKSITTAVNHVICLGSGELVDRTVIHVYCDANGNIVDSQQFFGVDEVAVIYDYSDVESDEELRSGGEKVIAEAHQSGVSKISFTDGDYDYEVGDIVGTKDEVTGITVSAPITKKVISVTNGEVTIDYSIGDEE